MTLPPGPDGSEATEAVDLAEPHTSPSNPELAGDSSHEHDLDRRAQSPGLVGPALSGALAAATALAAGELVASFGAPSPGPLLAVANRVIDLAPTWFVEFGKNLFGLNDKPALIVGTILISIVLGATFALLQGRSQRLAPAAFNAFGILGAAAIGTDPQGSWIFAVLSAGAAVLVGLGTLRILLGRLEPTGATATADPSTASSPLAPPVTRRGFLGAASLVGVASAAAAVGATQLRGRSSAEAARAAVTFDPIESEISSLQATVQPGSVASTPNISSLITPNDDFYLIDTALVKPQVDPANWSLTIDGMVDNPIQLSYEDLLERADTIAPVTLSCVSNEVGGALVGNAVWRGVPLSELLNEAGVDERATQIASRSVDGWTCGFPTEAAFDGRTALVAVGMNDEPLPVRHGFPARLVVSGLYGYVSATKWLSNIELTTWESFDGFWIPRGWSKEGPVKTQSRIDTPTNFSRIEAGEPTAIAGVAWAPNTGIDSVEVRVDEGPWQEAKLGEMLGADSWVQWLVPWTPTAGDHRIEVRATDAEGMTQSSQSTPPRPDGAAGWHRISVTAA